MSELENQKCQTLVSLVGENPLPVFFGIRQFAADGAQIVLVHSDHTRKIADNVQKAIERTSPGSGLRFKLESLSSAYAPMDVGISMTGYARRYPGATLNFTGGTKVMSAMALKQRAESDLPAFYLDETAGLFRFRSGDQCPLSIQPELSLSDLCTLHGVELAEHKDSLYGLPDDDLSVFSSFMRGAVAPHEHLNSPECELKWFKDENYAIWRDSPWAALLKDRLGENRANEWLAIDTNELPQTNNPYKKSELHKQYEYMDGLWLERLIETILTQLDQDHCITLQSEPKAPLISRTNIIRSQNFKIDGTPFECDILVLHDNRLRLISITTDNKLVKGKMFEAIHRARQVGGSLAKCAVVCLADDATCNRIQNSVDSGNAHRVFGKTDINRWLNDGDGRELAKFILPSMP